MKCEARPVILARVLILLVLAMGLAHCFSPQPTWTPNASPVPTATATPGVVFPPAATATPVTAAPPEATITPNNSSTPTASETATATPSHTAAISNPIQHIVIMDKENRTFDNMFGTFPVANGATTYTDPSGQVHPLNHQPDHLSQDISHDPLSTHRAYDNGKMDRFSRISGAIQNGIDMADSQFYQADIPNYWAYAKTFTLADAFFSTVAGPSFPNHLFSIAGEDADVDANPTSSK